MVGSNASGTPGGDHEATSGPVHVSEDHETWDVSAEVEAEKPVYLDDAPGEGQAMLEDIPGIDLNADTLRNFGGWISGPLLAASPWAWILRLSTVYEDGSDATYTGWLAAPSVVVTSARCLFDPSRGAAREVLVAAAHYSDFTGQRAIKSSEFRMVRGWVSSAKPECDYGAIILAGRSWTGVGHFGLAWLPGARPKDEWLNVAGYSSNLTVATQWYQGFQVETTDKHFLRRIGGFQASGAGSPLWLYMARNGRVQRYVCGMVDSNDDSGEALRLHRDMYSNLLEWIGQASNTHAMASGEQSQG